jgi:hypothetical protein
MYSAGGGPLQKAEVEGRIQNILSGFDKVGGSPNKPLE